jgi:hypothetical protein
VGSQIWGLARAYAAASQLGGIPFEVGEGERNGKGKLIGIRGHRRDMARMAGVVDTRGASTPDFAWQQRSLHLMNTLCLILNLKAFLFGSR